MQIIFELLLHYCPSMPLFSICSAICSQSSWVVSSLSNSSRKFLKSYFSWWFFLFLFFDALSLFSFLELLLTVFMLPQLESLVANLLCCSSFFGRKIDSPVSFCIFWCHHHSLVLLEISLKTIFPKNISDVITRLCFRCSLRFYCITCLL